ncbi:alpha-L-rhamnosidase-related protein [Gracilibacillus massiliensis]|uniref:alpha-L-rhamnosidase-related protein n=1 Tax=Gracilibacillus massiliensis TaxID=1564956 RepID=UPI00071DB54A|nr:amylo-alpha-1,6-glucosidase [Gracilibacillus massiliensis]
MNKKAYWIWYPGDWEIWLHEKVSLRREMREVIFPPFWRLDQHYSSVVFSYQYELDQPEEVTIHVDGQFSVYFDNKDNGRYHDQIVTLPAGKHEMKVAVYNKENVPTIYIDGATIFSNDKWTVSCYDKQSRKVGSWKKVLSSPQTPPSKYQLETKLQSPIKVDKINDGWFVDFGKETFGFLQLNGIKGASKVTVYYGESRAEAEDRNHCVLLDQVELDENTDINYTFAKSRAFRYVQVVSESDDFNVESIQMHYEYLPVEYRSHFRSSNQQLNQIWDTSLYTFHLNTREFFYDGIKRDRWVWSGDAYQSFLMNYYSFVDPDVVKRTLIALRGKDPIVMHINTILDYSLYWFTGIYDYYLYTGDIDFVKEQYPHMVSLLDFCLERRNEDGFMEGKSEDWVFVDWADIDNRGQVSTIQILLTRTLETMALVADIMNDKENTVSYQKQADQLRESTMKLFWDNEQQGLVHQRYQGELQKKMTKYPNIFALLYDYFDEEQKEKVKNHVLMNKDVQSIKTPYMRFFELAALCEVGEHHYVLDEMLDYWGGMLDLGATSFWEEYDPAQTEEEHYQMYDMKYGKSLCHAWGASPIYLIGKYLLGVKPLRPGYQEFIVEPELGGLDWFEGTIPVGEGEVNIYMDQEQVKVRSNFGKGLLKLRNTNDVYDIPSDHSWLEIRL